MGILQIWHLGFTWTYRNNKNSCQLGICNFNYLYDTRQRPNCNFNYLFDTRQRPNCNFNYLFDTCQRPNCNFNYVFDTCQRPNCNFNYLCDTSLGLNSNLKFHLKAKFNLDITFKFSNFLIFDHLKIPIAANIPNFTAERMAMKWVKIVLRKRRLKRKNSWRLPCMVWDRKSVV